MWSVRNDDIFNLHLVSGGGPCKKSYFCLSIVLPEGDIFGMSYRQTSQLRWLVTFVPMFWNILVLSRNRLVCLRFVYDFLEIKRQLEKGDWQKTSWRCIFKISKRYCGTQWLLSCFIVDTSLETILFLGTEWTMQSKFHKKPHYSRKLIANSYL